MKYKPPLTYNDFTEDPYQTIYASPLTQHFPTISERDPRITDPITKQTTLKKTCNRNTVIKINLDDTAITLIDDGENCFKDLERTLTSHVLYMLITSICDININTTAHQKRIKNNDYSGIKSIATIDIAKYLQHRYKNNVTKALKDKITRDIKNILNALSYYRLIISTNESEIETRFIASQQTFKSKRGIIEVEMPIKLIAHFILCPRMLLPVKIYSLLGPGGRLPTALGTYLSYIYHMNTNAHKRQANNVEYEKISMVAIYNHIESLLPAEKIIATNDRHTTRRRGKPLIEALNKLKEAGILEDYKICRPSTEKDIQRSAEYDELKNCYLKFKMPATETYLDE